MKTRIALALAVGLALLGAISIMGAAPVFNNKTVHHDTITIDSEYTDARWEVIDEVDIAFTDSAYAVVTVSGVATLDPGDRLYLGFGRCNADAEIDSTWFMDTCMVDTFIVELPVDIRWHKRVPFSFQYIDSILSQTDSTRYIKVVGAVGGSTHGEKVFLENLTTTGIILDLN